MRRKSKILIIYLLALFLYGEAQESITLAGCIESTRQNFPKLKEKKVSQVMNKALQTAIWYSYLPQLSMEGHASYQSHVTDIDINVPSFNLLPGTPPIQFPPIETPKIPKFQYNAYIQATQLIWDGGTIKALSRELQASHEAQLAQVDVEMHKVEKGVIELYFSLLMIDAQMHLQDILLNEINRQKNKIEKALDSGIATLNDLDRIEAELLKEKQQMTQLLASRIAIIQALRVFTGLDIADNVVAIRPETPSIYAKKNDHKYAPGRPEHVLLDAEATKADAYLSSYISEGMPKLALFARGGYGKPGLNMLDPSPSTYFVYGVKLNWNFGRLYGLKAQKKQNSGSKALIELKREALTKEIQATTAKLEGEAKQYREMLKQDDDIIALRERIEGRTKLQEEEGILSTINYLEQVSALNAAKQNKTVHELLLLKTLYTIANSLGY